MDLVIAFVLIALQILSVFIIGFGQILPRLFPEGSDPFGGSLTSFLFVGGAAVFGIVFLVWLGSVKFQKQTWRELGWNFDQPGRTLVVGLVGGAVAVSFTLGLLAVLGVSWGEIKEGLQEPTWSKRLLLGLIGAQVGVIEESLFRGNLTRALEKRMNFWPAWVLQAAIFSVYHLNFRPQALLGKFACGLIYGGARKLSGSLLGAAIAHFLTWFIVGTM